MRGQEQIQIVVDQGANIVTDFGLPVLVGITVAGLLLFLKKLFKGK